MANIKYRLIRPQGPAPNEPSSFRLILKLFSGCSLIVLIVLYYLRYFVDTGIYADTITTTNITNTTISTQITIKLFNATREPTMRNFFVNTSNCRMPAPDPFTSDVLMIYRKVLYRQCEPGKDLIKVNFKEGVYSLHMSEANLTCCYKQILRSGVGAYADMEYKLLPCSNFHQDFNVPRHVDAIITECRRLSDKRLLQQDAFSFVQPAKHSDNLTAVNDSSTSESTERRPSVLLWGIDSLSRMNFQRTMPLMFEYLKEENWFELQGYNKMADNTFPNLMAILTGLNSTGSISVCQPMNVGGLDACPMLWKEYKEKGYVTAYGEDWSKYSTFDYVFKGFRDPPTDYYARPLILAVEKELKKKYDTALPYCVGRRHFAEYIYDFALQFTEFYKNQSTFGMFWTNTFSHNNFALPSSMDAKIVEYMRSLQRSGAFEESIILFFSDHGMRFGKLRGLESGFLEERMPIMYIWLPHWFRQKYPEFAHNLQLNRNRLSSPYDIYATLKHILELETPPADLPRPDGCPNCHSLFYELDESRDCSDAGIDEHWCTCVELENVPKTDSKAKLIAEQLVEATNNYLAAENLIGICHILKLNSIESVQKKTLTNSRQSNSYLVRYETEPAKALFEATVEWNEISQNITISVPSISRMTSYNEHSKCIDDKVAKKFCICASPGS